MYFKAISREYNSIYNDRFWAHLVSIHLRQDISKMYPSSSSRLDSFTGEMQRVDVFDAELFGAYIYMIIYPNGILSR